MKFKKFAKYYIIATQGLWSVLALTVLGLIIGYKINENSVWPPILAVVGMLIGLTSFIYYLLKYQKNVDKKKKEEGDKS